MSSEASYREIPFNYTSADDRSAVEWLLGPEVWNRLEELRARRVTGRSARLLMRLFGEVLIHRRNPYLRQELVEDDARRRRFFGAMEADLGIIESNAEKDPVVLEVVSAVRALIEAFRKETAAVPAERRRILAELGSVVGRENVLFDPFALVSHATDATDWRLHLPLAVVMLTEEAQAAPVLRAIERLGCGAVPRGAGTGLTGGAIPLRPDCIVVNTEKLNRIRGIAERTFTLAGGRSQTASVMSLEAGVITERAMEYADERGLVFAVDPTSAWASTIGGNIAENAGGKTAVLWGTCVDNLLSFEIAMPGGRRIGVRRLDHPLRKILPEDSVSWEVRDLEGTDRRTVTLAGTELRRRGLWKDITNKALKGLPGLQKEGTDGIITSAEFVLYKRYPARATLCLEFFGPDMDEASRVILDLSRAFPIGDAEVLQALEHFDGEYVRAIGYKVKAPRAEAPKAVLLVDLVGRSPEETARGVARVRGILAPHANTALFVARDDNEAQIFWADRKKLGAIAAHTNAFKLNEDIVLPLEALAEFARFCDAINAEEERRMVRAYAERAREFLGDVPPDADSPWLAAKVESAAALCGEAPRDLHGKLLDLLRGYDALISGLEAVRAEILQRRVVAATHMHAGDGNVHVNIPILSSDRDMIRRAERVVDRVMDKVAELGGVCSGEHGIGVTKIKYLDPARLRELDEYRRGVDPRGVMNPGKLSDLEAARRVFTPSFNLMELEARILRYGNLEELALKVAHCVRCGKCKRDCCVFHPPRGLFYHPRNKNLAVGALIEALLYEAQRDRSAGFGMLRSLEDVADHCTICHKCLKPCPVDIDTGAVSILERGILVEHGFKHTAPATKAVLGYLESRSPAYNALFRAGAVRLGGMVLRVPPVDRRTLRDVLPRCEAHQALVFEPAGEPRGAVFYFPGCGSERLYGTIGMAALHVLLETGMRVVLPPPFLCCGFPHKANAQDGAHGRIVLRDTIILSQIREMFAYLKFDAVAVTCGTCRESLGLMEAGTIFGAPVMDVARLAIDRGFRFPGGGDVLYHAPCHDSLEGRGRALLERAGGMRVSAVPHCCSEAGTLSMSRPDISCAMRHRKTDALREALEGRPSGTTLLTNCPSCLQGLGRNSSLGFEPRHIVVELARRRSGDGWQKAFEAQASRAEAIRT